jgi:hypothetical protein
MDRPRWGMVRPMKVGPSPTFFSVAAGNLKKQQTLRERLNRGIAIDLDEGEFTVTDFFGNYFWGN